MDVHQGVSRSIGLLMQAMADRLSPGQDVAAKERELTLRRIAKLAKHQASFHLACKKYTQVCAWDVQYRQPMVLLSLHNSCLPALCYIVLHSWFALHHND